MSKWLKCPTCFSREYQYVWYRTKIPNVLSVENAPVAPFNNSEMLSLWERVCGVRKYCVSPLFSYRGEQTIPAPLCPWFYSYWGRGPQTITLKVQPVCCASWTIHTLFFCGRFIYNSLYQRESSLWSALWGKVLSSSHRKVLLTG